MSLQLATSLLEKADAQERACSYASALNYYEKGIAELMKILKDKPNNDRIRSHIEAFLARAELCKAQICAAKRVPPPRPVRSSIPHPVSISKKPLQPTIKKHDFVKQNSKHAVARKQSSDSEIRYAIESEIVDRSPNVSINDVIGLEQLKMALYECIVLPRLQPEIFSGLRKPPKAILLFGPPGNGKTMIAKAVATGFSTCTFFSISASSLTSKWVGQGEKLVRALFESAADNQPSVIFIDEIDSLLSSRGSSSEHEASRRLKTEFLVRFDGVTSSDSDNILLIAATNLPHELDEAVLRRFPRRFHIGQPGSEARRCLIQLLLEKNHHKHSLSHIEMDHLIKATDGYSSSDLTELCKEAAMWPIREIGPLQMQKSGKIRTLPPISYEHFSKALFAVKKSVSDDTIKALVEWDRKYGTDLSTVQCFNNSMCKTC